MTYPETIQYLFSQLPLFTRVGQSAYKANLDNTIELCRRLDDPQRNFKAVHVGGTNGKGSTSHMLAAILQTAGYKTGLYTSPHLKDFRERIRINGQMISEQEVIDFVALNRVNFDEIRPSFFEMNVALAFDVFAKERVEIAVIEVGLGGRLDSTNIITPLLSVITNIGWDHMNILGDTLQLIAAEKAGIIKPCIPVVIGERQPEVETIFTEKANRENSKIAFASDIFTVVKAEVGSWKSKVESRKSGLVEQDQYLSVEIARIGGSFATSESNSTTSTLLSVAAAPVLSTSNFRLPTSDFRLDLTGTYQLKNVKTVLCAVDELRLQGFNISDEQVKTALEQVTKLTGLRGRWEILSHNPLTICDTGHNADGMQEVLKNIASVNYEHLHFVIGMVNDKDAGKILQMLPQNATYYFCKPDIPRGLDAESLKLKAESFGLSGDNYTSVTAALKAAQQSAGKNDLVFVGGSTFVVAEVI